MITAVQLNGPHSLDESDLRAIFSCTPGISQETRAVDLNLGYGHLYYGLVRLLRPRHVLVIGSGFGFSVAVTALGLIHNGDSGRLSYVDPLYTFATAANWRPITSRNEQAITERLTCAGANSPVTHYRERNDDFFPRFRERGLPSVDLAIIDGGHNPRDVTYDWEHVLAILNLPGFVLLHDSTNWWNVVGLYGVRAAVARIRSSAEAEVLTFPGAAGLTLVRVTRRGALLQIGDTPTVAIYALIVAGLLGAGVGWLVGRRK